MVSEQQKCTRRVLDTCLLVAGWKELTGKVGYVIKKYGNSDLFAFNWG
jgi:hypothetical protein